MFLLYSEARHKHIVLVHVVGVLDLEVALMQGGDADPGVFQQILLDRHVEEQFCRRLLCLELVFISVGQMNLEVSVRMLSFQVAVREVGAAPTSYMTRGTK